MIVPTKESFKEPDILHPLDPLSPTEITVFKSIVTECVGPDLRFTNVLLREPTHETVDKYAPSQQQTKPAGSVPREIGAVLLDPKKKETRHVLVDMVERKMTVNRVINTAVEGQAPFTDEECFAAGRDICKNDPAYVAALAKRGITDLNKVDFQPLSAGHFGNKEDGEHRLMRILAARLDDEAPYNPFAHPIEGLVALVDPLEKTMVRLTDTGTVPIPPESGAYMKAPEITGPTRTDMKPLVITQPQGSSLSFRDKHILEWQKWSIRIGFNGREGLTLHDIHFDDQGEKRKILNRASISEMVVPYGEPTRTHEWQNYFDAGEFSYGRQANSLELGCDCLGHITYKDGVVVDDVGNPAVIKNAICIHEEDYGVLWKHTDPFTREKALRRQRRLVISFFTTVGNYDYGFYWYFYLDGNIQCEMKATGIVFTSGHPGSKDYPYSTEMAPGLGAPCHQHLFSARLDFAIDGWRNHVDEVDASRVPMHPVLNPVGNAFTRCLTRLKDEHSAQREADHAKGRVWRIGSSERTHRAHGGDCMPTGYVLFPEGGQPLLLAADEAPIRQRAAFATKHLWVTPFDRDEMWAAGYLPNQHPGGAGLPQYTDNNRPVDGEDIVVWHTFGLTHFPRPEDWPIMPTDYVGFKLKPDFFFTCNPTLDVPEDPNGSIARCSCKHNTDPEEEKGIT